MRSAPSDGDTDRPGEEFAMKADDSCRDAPPSRRWQYRTLRTRDWNDHGTVLSRRLHKKRAWWNDGTVGTVIYLLILDVRSCPPSSYATCDKDRRTHPLLVLSI